MVDSVSEVLARIASKGRKCRRHKCCRRNPSTSTTRAVTTTFTSLTEDGVIADFSNVVTLAAHYHPQTQAVQRNPLRITRSGVQVNSLRRLNKLSSLQ